MRIDESVDIAAPRRRVWEYVTDPANYPEFMDGVTRWEVAGGPERGLGARYRVLLRVGSAEVGGLIEVVEWNPEADMAWSSVTGVDQRGRWHLRDRPDGGTRLSFRFAYGVAGAGIAGVLAEHVAARWLRGDFKRSLRAIKGTLEAGAAAGAV
jgi:uncharacterized membrane protein